MTLNDAQSIALAPYLNREILREDIHRRAHQHDASRSGGVCYSGMGPKPANARSEDQIRAAAEAALARAEAFRQTARGRFLAALKNLGELGYFAAAEKARSAFARGFACPDTPAIAGEIAVALLALNDIPGVDAEDGRAALAELLLADHRRRAA